METISTLQKSMRSKITKILFLGAFIFMGLTSKAQCTASFTPFDSVGYGYFMNTSSGSGLTSSWDFGDGTFGSGTGDIIHLYSSPGTYYVCLTVTNFLATCTDTYCDSITIGVGGGSGACMGIVNPTFTYIDSLGTVDFSNTPSGSGPVYFWDFGDGTNSSVVGNTTHVYSSPGTYMVCLTVYETGAGTDSCQYCDYVTVGSLLPSCYAGFVIMQDSTDLYNYFVYNYSTTPGTTTYFWDFGDGTTSTLAYPSHTYADTIPVQLCLTVSDGAGCTATFCDSILTPGRSGTPFTINVMNPMGISENENTITALENYPNPFSDNTTINYEINKEATVSICIVDLLGNKIAEIVNENKTSGEYSVTWNSQGVSDGMYLLQLQVNNDIKTKKIIVNK